MRRGGRRRASGGPGEGRGKSESKSLTQSTQSRSGERRESRNQRQLPNQERAQSKPREHGERLALRYFVLVLFSFKIRTRMRPSEWKLPPVAVLASVSGSGGVMWVRWTTRPVLESVSLTYSRSPSIAGSIL